MSERKPAIELQSVDIGYGGEPVVRAVSLTVAPREIHVLLGESGSGKTTILRAVAGFEQIERGAIELFGEVVDGAPEGERGRGAKRRTRRRYSPPEKRRVGVVFQDYALFPHLDVAGNVGFGMGRRDRARVAELLDRVGLGGLGKRPVAELSGGQQQRVALARALAQEPRIILLDEPFSNLNRELRDTLRENTVEVLRAQGITAIFVTHDRHEAFALADRISVIGDGCLLQSGTCAEIYETPVSADVARSVGDVTILSGQRQSEGGVVACALGRLAARSSRSENDSGDACTIAIRPEQMQVTPAVDSDRPVSERGALARVTRRVYYGALSEVHLQLADGDSLIAHVPPGTVAVGDEVEVSVAGRVAILDGSR